MQNTPQLTHITHLCTTPAAPMQHLCSTYAAPMDDTNTIDTRKIHERYTNDTRTILHISHIHPTHPIDSLPPPSTPHFRQHTRETDDKKTTKRKKDFADNGKSCIFAAAFKKPPYTMAQTDTYTIDLHALPKGEQAFEWVLQDDFFQAVEQEEILGGEVKAKATVDAKPSGFVVDLQIEGEVSIVCDRCLDPMKQAVEGEETLLVKWGKADTQTDEDIIYVDEAEGKLDLSWLLYELIELSLPIVHSHQAGECNPLMEELLQSHLCTEADQPEEQ